ncbi:MAG TPA: glutaredoxin family protein [Anaerolineales bacterium]|nr:glutaredoxin family protein [Anaerolineales bacterium]
MPCKCMGSVYITIYRTPDSKEGRELKAYFDRRGVAYEDLDVSKDPKELQRMQELSGQVERPVALIDEKVMIGYDPVELEPLVPSFF